MAKLRIYLASPNNQIQAQLCSGHPVLISYANWRPWIDSYIPAFDRLLIDSGAFAALNSGKEIDVIAYRDWVQQYEPMVDAWAGLDCIAGDWRQSLKNYEHGGFPTIHDTDPPELLDDLIPLAEERGGWLGIGLKPPRQGKEKFLRRVLERVPDHIHIHGWALVQYRYLSRIDTFDSTHWFRQIMELRPQFPYLTPGECLEISIKKAQRYSRIPGNFNLPDEPVQLDLFLDGAASRKEKEVTDG